MNKNVLVSVIPELKAHCWEEALEELVSSFSAVNKAAVLDAIMKREAEGSTAIGSSIAIPHARIDGISELHVSIGRSTGGIMMGGDLVHIFLMVLIPHDAAASHIDFLSAAVRVLSNPSDRERIMEAATDNEILEVLF